MKKENPYGHQPPKGKASKKALPPRTPGIKTTDQLPNTQKAALPKISNKIRMGEFDVEGFILQIDNYQKILDWLFLESIDYEIEIQCHATVFSIFLRLTNWEGLIVADGEAAIFDKSGNPVILTREQVSHLGLTGGIGG